MLNINRSDRREHISSKRNSHSRLALGNHLVNTEFTPIGTKAEFAKQAKKALGRNLTRPEKILRNQFRKHFYRRFKWQYAMGPYILDFFFYDMRLVVEVDGPSHSSVSGRADDILKNAYLAKKNCTVLRFTNEQVFLDRYEVLRQVQQHDLKSKEKALLISQIKEGIFLKCGFREKKFWRCGANAADLPVKHYLPPDYLD